MDIKYIAKKLMEFTIINIFISLRREFILLLNFHNCDNIKDYWDKYRFTQPNLDRDRVVLVELLFEHVGTNSINLFLSAMINTKINTKLIGLISIPSRFRLKKFSRNYGVNKFAYVYDIRNIVYYIKAAKFIYENKKTFKYKKQVGISVVIDDQEVGDLIYDQYLRDKNIPTIRSVSFEYKVLIFKSIALYYRYKSLIKRDNVTDIILSHKVYSKYGLLARAAFSINKNIKIWQWFGLSPLNISCHIVKPSHIRMPRYYEEEYGNLIIKAIGHDNVEETYRKLADIRYQAKDKNQMDLNYVYKNTEIDTLEEFKINYNPKNNISFIFSHAFVDSVKYTDWQLYSDYYTWLEETLIFLVEKSKHGSIYVKPHPSEEMYPCNRTVKQLVDEINEKHHSEFIYLDKKVNNIVVFNIANSIITSNGTVAIEAACFGIPCLIAASSVYEKGSFTYQAKSINEYEALLNKIYELPKITEDGIFNAKLAFLWFNRFCYIHSELLSLTDGRANADCFLESKKLNNIYKSATPINQQKIYRVFNSLDEGQLNDTIDLP